MKKLYINNTEASPGRQILSVPATLKAGHAKFRSKSLTGLLFDQNEPEHSYAAITTTRGAFSNTNASARILNTETVYSPPTCLSDLERVGVVGNGGFGRVIEVRDIKTGRKYAMKLQPKETQSPDAAIYEAWILKRLRHPYIVQMYHTFDTPSFLVLLMEYCPLDLNRRILSATTARIGRSIGLPGKIAAGYLAQVMLALDHLHSQSLVFRDLKPENILITKDDVAKIADFGLTRPLEKGSTKGLTTAGTRGKSLFHNVTLTSCHP